MYVVVLRQLTKRSRVLQFLKIVLSTKKRKKLGVGTSSCLRVYNAKFKMIKTKSLQIKMIDEILLA